MIIYIDGYKKVLDYKSRGRLKNIDLILPVIELRLAKFCGHKQFKRINFHVIFSNKLCPDIIQAQFLNCLSAQYKLDPNCKQQKWGGVITKDNLENLGKAIKETVPDNELGNYGSDLIEGFNNLNLETKQIFELLQNANSYFAGKYLTCIGKTEWDEFNWNDNSIAEKKTIINSVNIVFTAAENIEKFNKAKNRLIKENVNSILLDCSDAHNNSDSTDKDRIGNCNTWIKADTTFDGLKQIVYQPSERIFIGDTPLKLQMVNRQSYYYLNSISIKKNNDAKNITTWFDAEIPLNTGLVAIIGNKGSGKSALADIIGYMVNSENMGKSSFLHKERFCKEDKNYAKDYHSKLTWCDDSESEKITLDEKIDDVQKAEYLPQKHIEDICNDLENKSFQDEINKVIFSYIDNAERLETTSLSDLLSKKTVIIDEEIMQHRNNLESIIPEFISLIKRKTTQYGKEINHILNKKKGDLVSHDKSKPVEVIKPVLDNKSTKALEDLNKALAEVERKIELGRTELVGVNIKISDFELFLSKYDLLTKQVAELHIEAIELTKKNELTEEISIVLTSNIDILRNKMLELKKDKNILQNKLDSHDEIVDDNNHELLLVEKRNIEEKIKNEISAAEDDIKKYQDYLNNLKIWNENRAKIEGNVGTKDTIKFCEAELSFIQNELASKEAEVKNKIIEETRLIYELLSKKINVNKELYTPVEEKLSKILQDDIDRINFETILRINSDFCNRFLNEVNQSVDSEYIGRTKGLAAVEKRIRECDLSDWDRFANFINGLIGSLFSNVDKVEQLLKNADKCLEYITKLGYIEVQFSLKMDNKLLSELSPGQRGNVLLVFYLSLNKQSEPLIIDQPEDNLDNQSVYNKLVPCILEAKKNRQVIIVTHNPNIAVACDAEQIICAHIDKATNAISYKSGSIENPEIRKQVIDILEGTMPAFDLRRIKYVGDV
jgi:ABC-type lipoprotein export system ATPase subunit